MTRGRGVCPRWEQQSYVIVPAKKKKVTKATQERHAKKLAARRKKRAALHSVPSTPLPKNPQACLTGLPAELRLLIYGYVFDSALLHIHYREGKEEKDGSWTPPKITWTPCVAVNPRCPQLCQNPKWSGLCKDDDRCTYNPDLPPNYESCIALLWTCKLFLEEGRDLVVKHATVSLPASRQGCRYVFDHFNKVSPSALRRVTFTGLDTPCMQECVIQLTERRDIEAIAFQGQVASYQFQSSPLEFQWRNWSMTKTLKMLPSSVDVAIEAFAWKRPRDWWSNPGHEELAVFRIIRAGRKVDDDGTEIQEDVLANGNIRSARWRDEDVLIESQRSVPVEAKRTAAWRWWWKVKDAQHL